LEQEHKALKLLKSGGSHLETFEQVICGAGCLAKHKFVLGSFPRLGLGYVIYPPSFPALLTERCSWRRLASFSSVESVALFLRDA